MYKNTKSSYDIMSCNIKFGISSLKVLRILNASEKNSQTRIIKMNIVATKL